MLIGVEGAKTPRKCYRISFVRGRIRRCKYKVLREYRAGEPPPHRRLSAEEAPRHARGKRAPGTEINIQI
jgi:hypothetical protein